MILAALLPASVGAVVSCKSDHVSAQAFGAKGSKAWGLLANDTVALNPFGTVSALDDLGQGKIDIAFAARGAATPLAAELRYTPIAWDAVVLIVHPNNPIAQLTLAQLLDVYAGRARNWTAVGGSDKAINLYAVAGPLDGIEYELRRALFGNGAPNVAAGRWYLNTQQLEDAIAIDPAALGVTTLSAVFTNTKLKLLTIEGVAPSMATLEDGTYLLAAPLYAVNRAGQLQTAPASQLATFLAGPQMGPRLRAKQMVPASQAATIIAALPARETRVAASVGRKPPVPPPPPIVKTAVNSLPSSGGTAMRRPAAHKQPSSKSSPGNALHVAQPTRASAKESFR